MHVVGFAGYSGSGKTTLLEKLIPVLKRRGLRISVIKHAHHRFDLDQEGKDSYRHRAAGAYEVLLASRNRIALLRELEESVEPNVHSLIAQLSPRTDWVLVEGFRDSDLLKMEVWRAQARSLQNPDTAHPVQYLQDPFIAAIATDSADTLPHPTERRVLDINNATQIADWLQANAHRFEYCPQLYHIAPLAP